MVKLLCAIVGAAGSSFPVDIDENETVGDLKVAIKEQNSATITCDANNLQLFLSKKETDEGKGKGPWLTEKDVEEGVNDTSNLKSLNVMREPLSMAGLSEKDVAFEVKVEHVKARTTPVNVLVVVPPSVGSKRPATEEAEEKFFKRLKLVEPKTLTEFTSLWVNEDEFQLDKLSTIQASASPIVPTPTLHKFWEGFGEFPPHYLVRMEEVVFWKVIKPLMFGEHRIVLIGSPGVGKSCFLMLLAFYLACEMKKKVLVIRRVKTKKAKNAVVFFDGQGSYARLLNLSSADIRAIRDQAQGALVLVDGFDQAAVEDDDKGFTPFDFLATSCQYDRKQDDHSRVVVLPAWRQDDLLKYATLTDWVVETGLREVKRVNTPFQELVSEQYFYSGGSLREFCENREMLMERVELDYGAATNDQAFNLVCHYGGQRQEDRLRRHYITDCSQEEHYYRAKHWRLSVDSGYVLDTLGWRIAMNKQLDVYRYAQSVGAGFYGIAYKLLLHEAIDEASAKRRPIVLEMREGSDYEKIEINVHSVVRSGDNEKACYECLSTLKSDTYWYPAYPFFPFIDAVATCNAFLRGSNVSEKVVAYIQVTIANEKTFKTTHFNDLESKLNANPSLKDIKRVFVVVGPDASVCARFKLHDAPAPATLPTIVSCFDPEQLKPKQA